MTKFNKAKVESYLKQFKESNGDKEFHIALLIYDRLDLDVEDVTEELIESIGSLCDSYSTIYNGDLNDELWDLID